MGITAVATADVHRGTVRGGTTLRDLSLRPFHGQAFGLAVTGGGYGREPSVTPRRTIIWLSSPQHRCPIGVFAAHGAYSGIEYHSITPLPFVVSRRARANHVVGRHS